MKGFFALYVREIQTMILLSPAPLFVVLAVILILMSGAVFFIAGLVFFHRNSGVRKGAE
ncbi:MAG: hypothetical protein Q8O92_10115 [Candidatus Latescibacter sp.]|nr:hypothetical protein [Candidatus Latescibacter sp.]